jgi:hypothetical protein
MSGHERFRVFRLDDDGTPVYIGTFEAATPKEAIKEGIYASGSGGQHIYEAHVLRNASLFDTRSRKEHFIDSVTQLNTQQHFAEISAS